MSETTPEQRANLRRLHEAATPGPCDCGHAPHGLMQCQHILKPGYYLPDQSWVAPDWCSCWVVRVDAVYEARRAAHDALPALLADAERCAALDGEVERLKASLAETHRVHAEAIRGCNDGAVAMVAEGRRLAGEEAEKLKVELAIARRDASSKECPACHGSGAIVLSDHGGMLARCDCAANMGDLIRAWRPIVETVGFWEIHGTAEAADALHKAYSALLKEFRP